MQYIRQFSPDFQPDKTVNDGYDAGAEKFTQISQGQYVVIQETQT